MHHHSVEPAAPAGFSVRVAALPAERDRVYRFRYESFAMEYGRWPSPALVARRMIRDEADDGATLFFSEADGRVVATLRLRVGPIPDDLRGPFDADRFALASGPATALVDEILVSRIYRKASLLEGLIGAASAASEEKGCLLLFCHARPDAVPAFRTASFQEFSSPFEHRLYGPRVPLVRFLGARAAPAAGAAGGAPSHREPGSGEPG